MFEAIRSSEQGIDPQWQRAYHDVLDRAVALAYGE